MKHTSGPGGQPVMRSRLPRWHLRLQRHAEQLRFVEERLRDARGMTGPVRELEAVRRYLQRILEELPVGACALGHLERGAGAALTPPREAGPAPPSP